MAIDHKHRKVMAAVFSTKPTPDFIQRFKKHVDDTGAPESFDGLYHEKISKNEEFIKLIPFDVPMIKRKGGRMIDCPMCSPNKYLWGLLAYFPRLRCVAAIGHCCADSDNLARANQEYDRRVKTDAETDYLIANIPLIPAAIAACNALMPSAEEARSIYRMFKRSDSGVWKELSQLKRLGGQLHVKEEISLSPALEGGPSGFRGPGAGGVETRDISLGTLQGLIMFNREFSPVEDLKSILATLEPLNHGSSEDDAYGYVLELLNSIDNLDGIYSDLQKAGKNFGKVRSDIEDFSRFFLSDNLGRLAAWVNHDLNTSPLHFSLNKEGDNTILSFRNRASKGSTISCVVVARPALWGYQHEWPIAST